MMSTRRLAVGEVIEDVVLVVVDDVVQHGMALAERAAFGILAGEAHGMAFDGERGEGERFGGRPIERLFALGHFLAALDRLLQLLVEMEAVGDTASFSSSDCSCSSGTPVSGPSSGSRPPK